MTADKSAFSDGGIQWICRNCEGGFPRPIRAQGKWRCPWCGEPLAKPFSSPDWDPMDEVMEELYDAG